MSVTVTSFGAVVSYSRVLLCIALRYAVDDSLARGEQTLSCGDPGINVLARLTMGMWPRNNSLADFFLLPWLVLAGNLYCKCTRRMK